MPLLLSDTPITKPIEDELYLQGFVDRLAAALMGAGGESITVGLYGAWGQGKTSVLNLLSYTLSNRSADQIAIVVRFNPWYYSSTSSLLLSFFGTLFASTTAGAWLNSGEKLALRKSLDAIAAFAVPVMAVTPLASIGPFMAATSKVTGALLKAGEVDLFKHKQDAARVLSSLLHRSPPRRVVVLIDDVDRADDEEIRVLFKLIKLVADLPNVSYVVAMDQKRVARALVNSQNEDDGLAYLEKIIQVPVHLPPVDRGVLVDATRRMIEEIFASTGHLLGDALRKPGYSGGVAYERTIARRIRTLRDRVRLMNNLSFLLRTAEPLELNAEDALVLVFIQTFYPACYERIRENKSFLTASSPKRPFPGQDSEQKLTSERKRYFSYIVTGSFEELPDAATAISEFLEEPVLEGEMETLAKLVAFLFPDPARGTNRDLSDDREVRINCKIRSPERFDSYFLLRTRPSDVPQYFIESLFKGIYDAPAEDTTRYMEELLIPVFDQQTNALRSGLQWKLLDNVAMVDLGFVDKVVSSLLSAQNLLPADLIVEFCQDLSYRAFADKLQKTGDSELASAAAAAVVIPLIRKLSDEGIATVLAAEWVKTNYRFELSNNGKEAIALAGLDRMRELSQGAADIFDGRTAFEATSVIWRWYELVEFNNAESQEVKMYLRTLTSAKPERLWNVVALSAGWSDQKPSLRNARRDLQGSEKLYEVIFGLEELKSRIRSLREASEEVIDPYGLFEQFEEIFS